MSKYTVHVDLTFSTILGIEAESERDAREIALKMFDQEEILPVNERGKGNGDLSIDVCLEEY